MKNVTVVIPTYNRPQKLKQTLDALALQDYSDFSVIISDDGSTSENILQIKKLIAESRLKIDLVTAKNSGASAATNRGIERAEDGLIILFDDDIIPEKETISKHVRFQEEHVGSLVAGGASTVAKDGDTDVQHYKVFMEREWAKKRPESLQLLKVTFDRFITTTANTSFLKSVFLKTGRFDESLRDGYDVDFAMRALLNDIPVYFNPNIRSIHNDNITLRYYARRQKAYTVSKIRIVKKNPDLAEKLKTHMAEADGNIKFTYRIARMNWFVSLAESGRLSWFLPKTLRYKIYGVIIAALSL